MVNDPIGDMIIQIKNASMAGLGTITLPYSNMKFAVAKILLQEGYLTSVEKGGTMPKFTLKIALRYDGKTPIVTDVKRKSKPGLRIYVNSRSIPFVVGGLGIGVVSTSQGIMTDRDARKKKLGGELLCEIW
jgi:small subunit ribosomal protein S8